MAGGLNLGMMGGVKASAQTSGYSSGSGAATASGAAFGPQYDNTSDPGTGAALSPNDAFGVAFWMAIAAIGALALIRHSLPR